jgi:hypothetical protein
MARSHRRSRGAAGVGATALLALGVGIGAACVPPGGVVATPGAGAKGTPEERRLTLSDHDVEDLVRDATAARQLAPKKPVAVVRLDLKSFRERLLGGRGGGDGEGEKLTADAAFMVGFDFVPQPAKRAGVASVAEVLEEQVVGFYDVAAEKVFIPEVKLKTQDELLEQRAVLAHEVHHAMQGQLFPKAETSKSSDEQLAQLALIEGDAQVAMGAWLGAEAGAPVGRSLRRIVEVTKRVPLASVTRGEENRTLDKALDIVKKRLEFPYRDGMMFVSDVYRAGGFPLVDKMYARPPRSTSQVLHPEKYLAGIDPRPVADPKPPKGYTLAAAGTMGELDSRVLLERCLDAETAERAATGWAGDRYAVFVGADRHLATVWVSAWDSDKDAEEMEAALGKSAACWHDNALGLAQSDFTIASNIRVRKKGKLVAFTRGLAPNDEDAVTAQLFGLVGAEPKPKPFTDLKIPPRAHLPEPAPGHLSGDVYRNDWIGVVGRLPQGMAGKAGGDVDFEVQRTDVLVRGGLSISTRITSDEQNERTFREVQEGFVAKVAELSMSVQALGGGPIKTALGAGVQRAWRIVGTGVELRLLLVPICAGTGSIVFVQVYGDPYARSVLDGWVESFRWINGRNITACDFLDPK